MQSSQSAAKLCRLYFFVIDGKGTYNLLLGRDWIYANCCVPSTMHQSLVQWIDDRIEIVRADETVNVASNDLVPWHAVDMECLSGKVQDGDYVKITTQGLEVVDQSNSKLFL